MLIPSGRVMLSADLIGDDNAHHRIRHRARHGLRGGVASPLQRFALVVPRRRPRRPRQRPRQQSCHGLCFMPGAHAPSMRHTHRVNACRRLVCRVSRFAASVVSSIRLRKPGSSTLPPLLSPPFFNPCVGTKVPSAERSGLRPPPRRLRRHLLRARKRRGIGVRAPRGPRSDPPASLWTPATSRVCRLPPRSGLRKQTPHVAPGERPDAVTATVPACRRILDQSPPNTLRREIPQSNVLGVSCAAGCA